MSAPLTEATKRRLTAFARQCIINSGGDPDAPWPLEAEDEPAQPADRFPPSAGQGGGGRMKGGMESD